MDLASDNQTHRTGWAPPHSKCTELYLRTEDVQYPGMHGNGTAEVLRLPGMVILNMGHVCTQETRLSADDLSSEAISSAPPALCQLAGRVVPQACKYPALPQGSCISSVPIAHCSITSFDNVHVQTKHLYDPHPDSVYSRAQHANNY